MVQVARCRVYSKNSHFEGGEFMWITTNVNKITLVIFIISTV